MASRRRITQEPKPTPHGVGASTSSSPWLWFSLDETTKKWPHQTNFIRKTSSDQLNHHRNIRQSLNISMRFRALCSNSDGLLFRSDLKFSISPELQASLDALHCDDTSVSLNKQHKPIEASSTSLYKSSSTLKHAQLSFSH